jgi:hypothetical protein
MCVYYYYFYIRLRGVPRFGGVLRFVPVLVLGDVLADGVVENGVVEDGVVENGVVEDGVVENGVVENDVVENDVVDDGVVENGVVDNGVVKSADGVVARAVNAARAVSRVAGELFFIAVAGDHGTEYPILWPGLLPSTLSSLTRDAIGYGFKTSTGACISATTVGARYAAISHARRSAGVPWLAHLLTYAAANARSSSAMVSQLPLCAFSVICSITGKSCTMA